MSEKLFFMSFNIKIKILKKFKFESTFEFRLNIS